ncbi:MAG: extracellular elastinolytic metalloproteinase [Actinomycetota bacterium]|jgi:hypothetical protein|nr:extracellular elastinolytic metalloproteinase [Actinomycetota bacterium]
MLKKILTFALVGALLLSVTGAAVAGKKKKGPKPYKSETFTIQVGHPAFHGQSGTMVSVTSQDFLQNCAVPSSNGVDAYVLEVPKEYATVQSIVEATGVANPDTPAAYDLDLYFYDADCTENGLSNNAGTDETGVMSAGTAFILVHSYTGGPVDAQVALKPY